MYKLLVMWLVMGTVPTFAQVQPVTIQGSPGSFQLIRNGQPYFVKGGGGDRQVATLAAAGGNSMRTWGTDANTIRFLDEAHAHGITVLMGLWVAHEAHGFDYNNTTAVQAQLEGFRTWVRMYKDHPAVLAWGVGNEVELGLTTYNPKVWNAINDIALMIKQEDGNHPTLTVTAGIDVAKAQLIMSRAPALDMLGVNAYGGINGVYQTLQTAGWAKPYMITEWGPNGQWESPTTAWGAPIEATSTEKAALYKSRYETAIAARAGACVGSYVFLWSDKFEQTSTWYGLFLPNSSDRTQAVEEMQYSWSGTYPANRAPRITLATVEGKVASQSPVITKDNGNVVSVTATDPDGDPLTFEFLIQPDIQIGLVNDPPATIPYLPGLIESASGSTASFRAPADQRNYRVFVFIRDGKGNAATVNIPFRVALNPMVSSDPSIIFPSKDLYIRNGEFANNSFGLSDRLRLQARFATTEGNTRETYLGFYVAPIDQRIVHVWLELYGNGTQGTQAAIFPLPQNDWTESMAWGNRKSTTRDALDTVTLDGAGDRYVRWDVTSYVNTALFFGNDSVSFVLRHLNESGNPSNWLSREARPFPPRLVFELTEGDIVLSLDEIEEPVDVYPNPAGDKIFLQTVRSVDAIMVSDMWGRPQHVPCHLSDKSVDVSALPVGTYLVRVVSGKKQMIKKVVKR